MGKDEENAKQGDAQEQERQQQPTEERTSNA
jgi:hypothetical protein